MEKENLNISKLSLMTNISYDRLHRAFKHGITDVFTEKERVTIIEASKELVNDQARTHQELVKFISK